MSEEKEIYETKNVSGILGDKRIREDLRLTKSVMRSVRAELIRQRGLYGVQRHSNHVWLPILTEELGEVAEALQVDTPAAKSTDKDNLYNELIQVAAVAISWAAQCRQYREESL